ncbi:MAG TPA: glycosyltransferase, partial [Candidatus Aminicenantes bacterium]|nr:glycosyltransferase [Candidatus Aminicenantes bacterium]
VVHLPRKGRGRMVKHAWKESAADIVTYMDIDLSTDLDAFAPMVQAIVDGYDIAIGSRQYKGAYVERSLKREVISRGYIVILKILLRFPFTDAQCGFKAASRKSFLELLPLIEDDEWFFDTELLHLATRRGYRVKELPVRWIEDLDSRVRIARTMWLDLKGVWRMMRSPLVRKKNIPPR